MAAPVGILDLEAVAVDEREFTEQELKQIKSAVYDHLCGVVCLNILINMLITIMMIKSKAG